MLEMAVPGTICNGRALSPRVIESPSIDRARVLGRVVRTAECALVSRERWPPPSIRVQHK